MCVGTKIRLPDVEQEVSLVEIKMLLNYKSTVKNAFAIAKSFAMSEVSQFGVAGRVCNGLNMYSFYIDIPRNLKCVGRAQVCDASLWG